MRQDKHQNWLESLELNFLGAQLLGQLLKFVPAIRCNLLCFLRLRYRYEIGTRQDDNTKGFSLLSGLQKMFVLL